MSEAIPQRIYDKEIWQRVILEEMIGTEAVRRTGLTITDFVKRDVQLELPYED